MPGAPAGSAAAAARCAGSATTAVAGGAAAAATGADFSWNATISPSRSSPSASRCSRSPSLYGDAPSASSRPNSSFVFSVMVPPVVRAAARASSAGRASCPAATAPASFARPPHEQSCAAPDAFIAAQSAPSDTALSWTVWSIFWSDSEWRLPMSERNPSDIAASRADIGPATGSYVVTASTSAASSFSFTSPLSLRT